MATDELLDDYCTVWRSIVTQLRIWYWRI